MIFSLPLEIVMAGTAVIMLPPQAISPKDQSNHPEKGRLEWWKELESLKALLSHQIN